MRRFLVSGVPLAFVVMIVGSGCAWTNLQEANRRLKESNDRLITENNRLAQELEAAQLELSGPRVAPMPVPAALPEPVAEAPRRSQNTANSLLIPSSSEIGPEVTVESTPLGIKLTLPERVFFASGQAQLSSQGQRILGKIAGILNRPEHRTHLVRVDGHTDDVPVRKVRHIYPTNWELSTARACTVVRYLTEKEGVSPRRIYPAGFAYYKPLESASSATARQKNRRVEILILNENV